MIFAIIFVAILILGAMGGAFYYVLKKTDPKNVDTSSRDDITTAQEFLPFTDIKDSMIHMGNHSYRAIVEVSSINYDLKTEKEQRVIEMSYTQFLNSLMFPITIFIATREMDNTQYLKNLQKDYEKTLETYPGMLEYANANLQDMSELNATLGTTRHKKKYIIIPFDEAKELTMQSDNEKYEYAAKQLAGRAAAIRDNLANLGIQVNILTTKEILELMISTYHRSGYNFSEEIWNKNYLSMIVESERSYFGNNLTDEDQLDAFVEEFKNKINLSFIQEKDTDPELRKKAEEFLSRLNGEKSQPYDEKTKKNKKEESAEIDDDDDIDDFIQKPKQKITEWQGVLK